MKPMPDDMKEPVITFREPKRTKPMSQICAGDFPRGYNPEDVMTYDDCAWPFVYVEPTREPDKDLIKRLYAACIEFEPMPPKGDYPIIEFKQKEYCDPKEMQGFIEDYCREHKTRGPNELSESRKSIKRRMEWLGGWAERMQALQKGINSKSRI